MADGARHGARRGWLRRLAASLAGGGAIAAASAQTSSGSARSSSGPVDAKAFGAIGDGVVDDTAAIQAAIDAGTTVRIPVGTYRVGRLRLRSNLTLIGEGPGSVLQASPGTTLLHALSPSPGSVLENLELRSLRLVGAVVKAGFSEHVHLVSIAGSRQVLIDSVQFIGFQGDGLYLGAHTDNTRHNTDVRVVNCSFDGLNKNNRNGISVIDGDGVFIQGCVFRRTSRRDMPGFIDVEPNDAANVVRNIQVTGNHFEDTDGAVAAISFVVLKPRLKEAPGSFIVSHNTFDIDIRMLAFRIATDYGTRHNLVVTGNSGRVASLGDFYPLLRGAALGQNTLSVTGPAAFGYERTDSVTDLSLVGNTLDGGGAARGALDIRCGGGHVVSGNVFSHFTHYGVLCGLAGGSLANVSILGNVFSRCGAQSVMSAGGIDGASCRYLGNVSDATHLFPAWINDDTGAITNGTSAPLTFNASTPPSAFARPGIYRAALDADRAAPVGGARQGLLETRVERGRNATLWRVQRFYPAPDAGPSEAYFTRSDTRAGSWSPWLRHLGSRGD